MSLARFVFRLTVGLISFGCLNLQADIKSTKGSISFDRDGDGNFELHLGNRGLSVGGPTAASTNLEVSGNAKVSQDLVVGSTDHGHSTFQVVGTVAYEVEQVSDNVTLSSNSKVFVNSSSGNITVTLPSAANITGRVYEIYKVDEFHSVEIEGLDNYDLSLNESFKGFVKLISLGSDWHVTDQHQATLSWTPKSMSLNLWLDATDLSTIIRDASNNVSQWSDKSGNDNHATQSTGTDQARYLANGWTANSNPTVNFDGSGDGYKLASALSTARDIFIVEDGVGYMFSNANQRLIPIHTNNLMYWNTSPNITSVDVSSWRSDTTQQMTYYSLDTSGNYTVASDGVDRLTGSGSSGSNDLSRIGLKWDSGTSVPTWTGNISEIIVTDAVLSQQERQRVEGYLAHKWGLEGSLEASHPFKNNSP